MKKETSNVERRTSNVEVRGSSGNGQALLDNFPGFSSFDVQRSTFDVRRFRLFSERC